MLYQGYDDMSRRTIQVATIGGTTDFLNLYAYDARGRLERLDQSWVSGNVVAIKRVDFSYNLAGQFQSINRYADYSGTQLVATSAYGYDAAGRIESLLHQRNNGSGLTDVAGYGWQWDNANRITQFTNSQHTGENVDYDYDNSGQLVGADYDVLGDEDYTYDDNGNRQQATQPTSSPPEGIWNFNEGSGSSVADGSGNGHTGTINGSPTWSSDTPSAGLGEYSLLVNDSNSEYVSVGSNLLTGDFTVSLFFKAQNAGALQILFWQGETQLYLTGGKLTGRVFNTSGQSVVVTHPTTLANNTWYHAVLRFDGDTVSVALDGDVESSAFSHVNKTIIPGQVYINRDETATSGMAGRLADVRLYDRAITDVEIEQIVDGHPDQAVNSYSTGANNRLDSDGTYDYEYDGEGNLIKQTETASGDYRVFEWDHRNRLASISDFDDTHDLQLKVNYTYDAFDRLIGKQVDTDGNGTINATEAYVYDGNQIVLRFADDDGASLAAADLANRYLWGPSVDQLLAEENVTSLTSAGTVDWPLTDHQNTIRDWASYSGGTTTITDHAEYDAFGNRLDAPVVDSVFGYTGRIRDADTGLQWNGSADGGGRWYDPAVGRWISEDRIGFNGDPSNLYRYVGNSPTIHVDPSGLAPLPCRDTVFTTDCKRILADIDASLKALVDIIFDGVDDDFASVRKKIPDILASATGYRNPILSSQPCWFGEIVDEIESSFALSLFSLGSWLGGWVGASLGWDLPTRNGKPMDEGNGDIWLGMEIQRTMWLRDRVAEACKNAVPPIYGPLQPLVPQVPGRPWGPGGPIRDRVNPLPPGV